MSDCEICREENGPGVSVPRASTWRESVELDKEIEVCESCAEHIDYNASMQDAQDHPDEGMAQGRDDEAARRQSYDRAENDFLNHHYLGDRT